MEAGGEIRTCLDQEIPDDRHLTGQRKLGAKLGILQFLLFDIQILSKAKPPDVRSAEESPEQISAPEEPPVFP